MKVAIVTGASSGIGQEFVRQIPSCYRKLDEIWVVARHTGQLKELAAEIERSETSKNKISVRIFDGDLLRDYIYVRIQKALEAEKPEVRMLVNAAGFGKTGTIEEIGEKAQEDMIDLNCRALTKMTTLCLPYCGRGTRIVNIASAAAFAAQPKFGVYAATKAYVLSFSRALSAELKEKGVIVTAVCPGPVDTPFFQVSGDSCGVLRQGVMADAEAVVKQALYDAWKARSLSVYGAPMRASKIATKLLPDKWLLYVMWKINK